MQAASSLSKVSNSFRMEMQRSFALGGKLLIAAEANIRIGTRFLRPFGKISPN